MTQGCVRVYKGMVHVRPYTMFKGLGGVVWGCGSLGGVVWGCRSLCGVVWGCGLVSLSFSCLVHDSNRLHYMVIYLDRSY